MSSSSSPPPTDSAQEPANQQLSDNTRIKRAKGKIRLDQFLVEAGLCASKSQAQAQIIARQVSLSGKILDKPGGQYALQVLEDAKGSGILKIEKPLAYVSRGGLKLEKALDSFGISPKGLSCLDVGASTGGFTDCLLQRGASRVYALDVGHGQLDWKLRQDPRVVCLEKTNIKQITPALCPEPVALCVMDVSFISLKKALGSVISLFEAQLPSLAKPPYLICLIKPQFEYKDYCSAKGFDGVVKDAEQHQRILEGLLRDIHQQYPDLALLDLAFSPITGPKGNIEFLLSACYQPESFHGPVASSKDLLKDVSQIVQSAHEGLLASDLNRQRQANG